MVKVIGIKFKTSCRIYYFDPLDLPFHAGDGAIVETSRGIEFGEVTCDPKEVEESEIVAPLKPVLRIATEEDKQMREMYRAKEPETMAICEEKIKEHGLDMKLVDVECNFDRLAVLVILDSSVHDAAHITAAGELLGVGIGLRLVVTGKSFDCHFNYLRYRPCSSL